MWIIEYGVNSKDGSTGNTRAIVLKPDRAYTLGRSPECDISVDIMKVSRNQCIFQTSTIDDSLSFLNKGHARWIDSLGNEINGSHKEYLKIDTNVSYKLRSINWEFKLIKISIVNSFKISGDIEKLINGVIDVEMDTGIPNGMVMINGENMKIKDVQGWIGKLRDRQWDIIGDFKGYEKENSINLDIDSDSDVDMGEIESILEPEVEKKHVNKSIMVDVKPFTDIIDNNINTQLYESNNRSTKRSQKSQMEKFLDDWDEMDDLDSYKSSNEKINEKINEKSIEEKIIVNKPIIPLKRGIIEKDTLKKKIHSSVKNNDNLTNMFKQTKIIKMANEEKLMNSLEKPLSNELIKIKKFQVNIGNNTSNNPRIYSNYQMLYGSNNDWKDRLNYSKFNKVSNGADYNPIMDSTIQTIKMKSANYKSNEVQVNLYQNDDMIIPELDDVFNENRGGNKKEFRKRKRETTLFIESDYEDDGDNIGNANTKLNNIQEIQTLRSRRNRSTKGMESLPKQENFFNDETNSYDNHNDDDDTPVFKSRRR
ncbi:hypothetical protein DAPK24_030870 [Pichia kluyveri]|uniref:FHA domain-containing protein n=1 Tax=Pichia kluyveri TaxID=36015 RepID=A0AAV5R665_PICKL|nr:hypothetical protein DAPK24_030870 [Pichia kluyveri]